MIGAGVMGLTTARLVQEAGFPVTIYAKALPPDTTSNIAGGQWHPFGHYPRRAWSRPNGARSSLAALDYSWRRFQIMVGDDYGIAGCPPTPRPAAPRPPAAADAYSRRATGCWRPPSIPSRSER